jgi:dTDP-4-amino-4,6-dideoxygalactose transaminase
MVTTNDPDATKSLQMLRNYGQEKKYHHLIRGYNRRLDNLQAALLRVKLKHLDDWNEARRDRSDWYQHLLAAAVLTPVVAGYAEPVWHLYVIQVDDRDELQTYLGDRGIGTGIHYPIPIHLQPAYRDLGYQRGDFPIAEQTAASILSLPMYPELRQTAVEEVAGAVAAFVAMRPAAMQQRQMSVE